MLHLLICICLNILQMLLTFLFATCKLFHDACNLILVISYMQILAGFFQWLQVN